MPGQQFIQPVDLVIMDAVEDVSEICQRVEAVKFSTLLKNPSLDAGTGT